MTVSHNYVAPAHTTCKVLDDIENVDVSEPYNQRQGQELSLETKESTINILKKWKTTSTTPLQIPKTEYLLRTTIFPPEMVRICQNEHDTTNYTMFSFLQTQAI